MTNKNFFLVLTSMLCMAFSNAQGKTITGTVEADGAPLPGVNVLVQNTTNGTQTDFDGNYTINASEGDVLSFSYLGFKTQNITVGSDNIINIGMIEDASQLEEVVVVGYGTQLKRDLVGAVSEVKSDDLILSSSASVGDVLRGKAAGLQILQNSAQPGGGLDFQIRGAGSISASNAPLIVVDGFPLSDFSQAADGNRYNGGTQGILNSFNPNDIETISVLKDASSTAIYGARAANGVIIITTKRGTEGKMNVDYSSSVSFQTFNQNSYDVLSLPEWMQLRNDAAFENWSFLNRVTPYSDRTLDEAIADPVNGIPFTRFYSDDEIRNAGSGTNWLDLITREGIIQQHNVSIRGGNEKTRYFLSGNLFEHKGVIEKSDFDRTSFRFNIDQKINDYLNFGLNFTTSRINNQYVPLGGQAFENSGIIRSAIQYNPLVEDIDENGNYPINPDAATTPNPFSLLTISDEGRTDRSLANFYLEFKPVAGLTARVQGGFDRGVDLRNTYLPRTTLWGELEGGRASIANNRKNDKLFDFTLNYNKELVENHRIDFLLGYSTQEFVASSESQGNNDFISDSFLWNNLNAGAGTRVVNSNKSVGSIVSYFTRLNYVYKDRYILTSTLRRDGSSNFAENNKFGLFPSVAFGWNIAEEPFIKNLGDKITNFKLRLSYGELGNSDIGGNAFGAFFSQPAFLNPDESIQQGVFATRLANPDLKWETTKETNIGLDFGFFDNRISGSAEYFDKKVVDLLFVRATNSFDEVPFIADNIGSTQSKGVEITLNTSNVRSKDFEWASTLTYATYDDRWLEREPTWVPSVYQSDDDPIRAQYSSLSDGIMQIGEEVPAQPDLVPGQVKIKDLNGFVRDASGDPVVDENGRFQRTGEADGRIDEADIVLLGSTDPDFTAGFSNRIRYKNFQLNAHFNGVFGRRITDATDVAYGVNGIGVAVNGNNATRGILDRWTPDNPSTTRPGSHLGFSDDGLGDIFLQDAWFIRLQNVSLSYAIPKGVLGKYFTSASIRLDAQNLFTITPFTGLDPETIGFDPDLVNNDEAPATNLVAAYPNVTTYTVGLDLKF